MNLEYNGKGKKGQIFLCEKCDYVCSKQYDWNRHVSTNKHTLSNNWNSLEGAKRAKRAKIQKYGNIKCDCGKLYETQTGLWKHKKKCEFIGHTDFSNKLKILDKNEENNVVENSNELQNMDTSHLTQLFIDSIKQNQEFQKQMFEMLKDNIGVNNNTINSNNNTTNNQFNLQFFLNETCKDAMNINDFIDYVKVKLEDFENFGDVGYPKALGDIIVRNLNELDVKIRPIHCSDLKREVLYIKHDGVWHNDEARDFMKRSIMYIAHKNIKQIPQWQEENPESKNHHSKTFERYNKMFRASLGAANDDEQDAFLKKITSLVAKEVVIDKRKKY